MQAHTFKEHGIDINPPKVNIKQMINRKADVVKQMWMVLLT